MMRRPWGMHALPSAAALIIMAAPANAQRPDEPATANAASAGTDAASAESAARSIDLGLDIGDRMTLPVHIAGQGPYPFIIDTGSQRSIVSTELARQLSLTPAGKVAIVSMSGRATVDSVQVPHLRYGTEEVARFDALSIARANLGGVGIIGLDGLRDKKVTIDFRARALDVTDSAGPEKRRTHEDGDVIVVRARSRLGQLILVDSRVDGQRVNVILDTGAEMSIGNLALFSKMKARRLVIPPRPITLTSVTGEAVTAQFSIVKRISIGTVTLQNVPMVFVDAPPFAELGYTERPAMLLGMEMLQMFNRIAIDFGRREVNFITPRSRYDSADRLLASN